MRRADAWLVIVVGALAVFVGVEIARAPRAAIHATSAPESRASAPSADAPASPSDADVTVTHAATQPPVRDLEDIRARIAAASDTYIADMLAGMGETLIRWPDLRDRGLKIWVQSQSSVPDWDLRYAQMARDAFDDWSSAGLPMRFEYVIDSVGADIRVAWVDRFPTEAGMRVGSTRRAVDQNGWLAQAQISIAIHDSTGRAIPPAALAAIARHEAGHALGLGHSRDEHTLMYPIALVDELTPLDRATMRLLYELPPGPVR